MSTTHSGPGGAAVATFVLAACLLSGCTAPSSTTRIVCGTCEEPDRFVRLQTYQPSGRTAAPQTFAHPLSLSPEEWTTILASIEVQATTNLLLFFTQREPDQPAFRPDERAVLSGMLSKAFVQAQANELVVFGLTERDGKGIMKMTTGGWFAKDGHLHLILANYRFAVTMESIRERLIAEPLRPTTGRTFEVAAGPHQRIVKDRKLVSSTIEPDPVELAVAYRPLLADVTPAGPAPSAVQPDRRPSERASIEERLDRLERLRETGRITEDEYQQKRKELLGHL